MGPKWKKYFLYLIFLGETSLFGQTSGSPYNCCTRLHGKKYLDNDFCLLQNTYDAIILPGGLGGAKALAESKAVGDLLKQQEAAGRICAAICAGPTAFLSHSIGLGKKITSYPSVKDQLVGKYAYVDDQKVVIDGNIVTSRGPGTAFDFGLKLGEILVGAEVAKDCAEKMLL